MAHLNGFKDLLGDDFEQDEDSSGENNFIKIRNPVELFEEEYDEDAELEYMESVSAMKNRTKQKRKQQLETLGRDGGDTPRIYEPGEPISDDENVVQPFGGSNTDASQKKVPAPAKVPLYLLNPNDFRNDPAKQQQIRRAIMTYRHHQEKKHLIYRLADENKKLVLALEAYKKREDMLLTCCTCDKAFEFLTEAPDPIKMLTPYDPSKKAEIPTRPFCGLVKGTYDPPTTVAMDEAGLKHNEKPVFDRTMKIIQQIISSQRIKFILKCQGDVEAEENVRKEISEDLKPKRKKRIDENVEIEFMKPSAGNKVEESSKSKKSMPTLSPELPFEPRTKRQAAINRPKTTDLLKGIISKMSNKNQNSDNPSPFNSENPPESLSPESEPPKLTMQHETFIPEFENEDIDEIEFLKPKRKGCQYFQFPAEIMGKI